MYGRPPWWYLQPRLPQFAMRPQPVYWPRAQVGFVPASTGYPFSGPFVNPRAQTGLVKFDRDYGPPFKVDFLLDLFKGDQERELSEKALRHLLDCLTAIHEDYLRAHPETPSIYAAGVRYIEEPPGVEEWMDIPTIMRRGGADCVPLSTQVLKEDYTFCSIGELAPGDRIMGDGKWTTVFEMVVTGDKPILAFGLSNGCVLRCSPEHRLFLRDGTEVRAHDVKVGADLKAPSEPFPCQETTDLVHESISEEDLAWLVGIYIADGWCHTKQHAFHISGDDETPKRGKREQKDRVEQIMRDAGIGTHRVKKYVTVKDSLLTALMMECGYRAPNKMVPEMRLTRSQVASLVKGLQTDCSVASNPAATLTHGTVSPTLAMQLRILYRMLGQSVHIKRWDNHGGLGSHPIYRITVRKNPDEEATTKSWTTNRQRLTDSVRVRSITEEAEEMCADIETDTGKFYLPECDLVVHNCEELASWRAAELRAKHNIDAKAVWPAPRRRPDGGYLYHIVVRWPDGREEDPSRILGMK